MIEKLHIKNFLAFPELEVPELKLINLVAGKNNAGKTALLEALRLLRASSKVGVVRDIATKRSNSSGVNKVIHHKDNIFAPSMSINNLVMRATFNNDEPQFSIDGEKVDGKGHPDDWPRCEYEFVSSKIDDHDWIARRWNSFVLTDKEDLIVQILSLTTEMNITRIAVTNSSVMLKLDETRNPIDIRSVGDGMMRLLQVIMALVEAKPLSSNLDGLLLIDEIETHLHHSVIRKLWKIIFEYAIKWNIQVVATTHSQDAIREFFYEAAANESYKDQMQVLRLQVGRSGKHEVIEYPYEQLEFMMDTNLEIRGN